MNTHRSTRRLPILCLGIAAHDTSQLTVRYNDLNLATPQGASVLYARIRGAARFVCGEEGVSLDEKRQWQACEHAAITQAVSSVHSPLLTTLEDSNSAAAIPTVLRGR
jgi:UrcA family protein